MRVPYQPWPPLQSPMARPVRFAASSSSLGGAMHCSCPLGGGFMVEAVMGDNFEDEAAVHDTAALAVAAPVAAPLGANYIAAGIVEAGRRLTSVLRVDALLLVDSGAVPALAPIAAAHAGVYERFVNGRFDVALDRLVDAQAAVAAKSSISCCPFGHIQSDAENFSQNSTKFCIRLNCTTSAHCTAAFQHSRCSFFTKQCICDYNTVLDFESQQCVPKDFNLIQADDDDEPQYSASILQWLPRSGALLFLLFCLVIWTKLTVDYLQRKWETSKNRKTFNGNQQVVSPQLKAVNMMLVG
ncbi:hypothetical protein TYRP_020982 [Tyrophagus putrescentiae]|nr:hypothetical protein TYRP_020982 [Tyrophagus putrescentiae]